jgi:hypothetical protein
MINRNPLNIKTLDVRHTQANICPSAKAIETLAYRIERSKAERKIPAFSHKEVTVESV